MHQLILCENCNLQRSHNLSVKWTLKFTWTRDIQRCLTTQAASSLSSSDSDSVERWLFPLHCGLSFICSRRQKSLLHSEYILYLSVRQSRLAGHIPSSARPSICSFVFLLLTCERYTSKTNELISMQIGINLSPGAKAWTVDLWGQEVKDQGHMRPRLCLEAWQKHHSRSLESSKEAQWATRRKCCLWRGGGVLGCCVLRWLRGAVVERWYLTGELPLSCARPIQLTCNHLCGKPFAVC